MPRITPNDPRRLTEHDFLVLDFDTPGDDPPRLVAAFDNQAEAMRWVMQQSRPGKAWVLDILHPEGCGCNPTEPVREGIEN